MRTCPSRRTPGCNSSAGVSGSSETRMREGVRSGSRPKTTTRSSSTRGRSLAERSRPTTRPSTFAVISCDSTGAATIRLRSAAAAKPTAGKSTSKRSIRVIGLLRTSVPSPRRSPAASAASIQACGSEGMAK